MEEIVLMVRNFLTARGMLVKERLPGAEGLAGVLDKLFFRKWEPSEPRRSERENRTIAETDILIGSEKAGTLTVTSYMHDNICRIEGVEYNGTFPGYVTPRGGKEFSMVALDKALRDGDYGYSWQTTPHPLYRVDYWNLALASHEIMRPWTERDSLVYVGKGKLPEQRMIIIPPMLPN